jgi:hypothetical protein
MEWTIITTISTAVIAVFAVSNFILAASIKNLNKKQQREFVDSLQALVVATLSSAGQMPDEPSVRSAIGWFNKFYNGKTQIFPDDQ